MARPAFEPTKAMRQQVARLAAGGVSHDDIARVIGVARGTLLKYFGDELTTGAARVRAEAIDKMRRLGMKGNASALDKWIRRGDLAPTQGAATERPPKPGKKELAQQAAETAAEGTGWDKLVH